MDDAHPQTSNGKHSVDDYWARGALDHKPNQLCAKCQALFEDAALWHDFDVDNAETGHSPVFTTQCIPFRRLGDLLYHADRGCHLCARVHWSTRELHFRHHGFESQYANEIPASAVSSVPQHLLVDQLELFVFCGRTEGLDGCKFGIFLYAQGDEPGRLHIVACEILRPYEHAIESQDNPSSYDGWRSPVRPPMNISPQTACKFVQSQMVDCKRWHEACGPAGSFRVLLPAHLLPARLLKLSHQDIRLIRTTSATRKLTMQL